MAHKRSRADLHLVKAEDLDNVLQPIEDRLGLFDEVQDANYPHLSDEQVSNFEAYLRAFTPAQHVERDRQGLTMHDWLRERDTKQPFVVGKTVCRIKYSEVLCSHCSMPATYRVTSRSMVGTRKVIGFYYYCDAHAPDDIIEANS